jgi:hypothetical protein
MTIIRSLLLFVHAAVADVGGARLMTRPGSPGRCSTPAPR